MMAKYFDNSQDFYRKLLGNEASHDVCFYVGGERVGVNKAILAANSDYFNTLLNNKSFVESGLAEITLEDVSPDIFKLLIEFCYLRNLNLSKLNAETLRDLLIAANRFQVIPLLVGIKKYVLDGDFITPDNCFYWKDAADSIGDVLFGDTIKSRVKNWHAKAIECK